MPVLTTRRLEVLADGGRPVGDPPGVVSPVGGVNPGVELGQAGHPSGRDQVVAAEAAALALDAALLVAALDAGDAVERVEAVVAPEGHPALRLPAVAANEHALHGRLQVVVAHLVGRGSAQHVERVEVALQEGLLTLAGEDPVHRLAGAAEAKGEQKALGDHAGEVHPQLGEVHLGFGTGLMRLGHETFSDSFPASARISGRRRAT